MAKPYRNTLADYVVIGFSPVLLVGLLTCLVWFLLEMLYTGRSSVSAGEALWQLRYILFWFVMAVVLITRLSLTDSGTKAIIYGLILGLVVTFATLTFVKIPVDGPLGRLGLLVPPALLALTWVCAHWITKDCTHISEDEEDESANVGVMDQLQDKRTAQIDDPLADTAQGRWMADYQQERAKERRKHAPGTLVVYFSLAALPLFGLGQAIIPRTDPDGRRYIFWLLVGYVGCGLGLLMTTTFLGLRRYMYLRKLRMPRTMTGTWLGLGAATVVLLLLVGAFLPRPDGFITFRTPLEWWKSSSEEEEDEEEASNYAVTGGKAGQGEGSGQGEGGGKDEGGQQGGQHDPNAAGVAGGQRGQGNQSGGGQQQGGNQPQSGQDQQGAQRGGQPRGEQRQGQDGQQGQQRGQQGQQGQQGQNPNDPNRQPNQPQDQGNRPGGGADPRQEREGARSGARSRQGQRGQQRNRASKPSSSAESPLMNFLEKLFWIVVVLGGLFALFWYRRQIWAWLQQFLRNPLAWFRREPVAAAPAAPVETPPRPFSSFRNPFNNPSAFPNTEVIVQYSFDALQSWAYDHRLPRRADETPLEFADRFGGTFRDLEPGSQRLANLYSLVTYARSQPTEPAMQALREFWGQMEKAAPTYMGVA